jgi:hypothetical protein
VSSCVPAAGGGHAGAMPSQRRGGRGRRVGPCPERVFILDYIESTRLAPTTEITETITTPMHHTSLSATHTRSSSFPVSYEPRIHMLHLHRQPWHDSMATRDTRHAHKRIEYPRIYAMYDGGVMFNMLHDTTTAQLSRPELTQMGFHPRGLPSNACVKLSATAARSPTSRGLAALASNDSSGSASRLLSQR